MNIKKIKYTNNFEKKIIKKQKKKKSCRKTLLQSIVFCEEI
jgi:hypothetical protein